MRKVLHHLQCLPHVITPIEDLIAEDFGNVGTPERDAFEMDRDAFIIGE